MKQGKLLFTLTRSGIVRYNARASAKSTRNQHSAFRSSVRKLTKVDCEEGRISEGAKAIILEVI
jgi:hypothetical protein